MSPTSAPRSRGLVVPAVLSLAFTLAAALGCSGNGGSSTGTGGKGGSAAGGSGGSAAGGSGGSAAGGSGGSAAGGSGGSAAGGSGGSAAGGSGGSAAGGSGGSVTDGGTDAAGGSGGGATDARPDGTTTGAGGGDGGVIGPLAGTATRPLLTTAQAANFTVLKYLAQAGSLTAPTVDNWDPTAGVGDVATFTPMFTVAATGGTHTSVQAAITAAPAGTARVYIRVLAGAPYRGVVCVPAAAPPITLYSTETVAANMPVIVYNNLAGLLASSTNEKNPCAPPPAATTAMPMPVYGTDGSATLAVYAPNFQAKNLVISNDGDESTITNGGTQGVALQSRGDKLIFENVRFLGHQDTVLVKSTGTTTIARAYFKGCYAEGDVDFLCGRGVTVWDGGELRTVITRRATNNNILAPSTEFRNPYGILVTGAMITGPGSSGTLGRAWDESQSNKATFLVNVAAGMYTNGQTLVRNSMIGANINATAPWAVAATTARVYSSTDNTVAGEGTYPANRLYEFSNTTVP